MMFSCSVADESATPCVTGQLESATPRLETARTCVSSLEEAVKNIMEG